MTENTKTAEPNRHLLFPLWSQGEGYGKKDALSSLVFPAVNVFLVDRCLGNLVIIDPIAEITDVRLFAAGRSYPGKLGTGYRRKKQGKGQDGIKKGS
jgi:hypothetical protein